MIFKVVNKNNYSKIFDSQPLRYRVSITIEGYEVVLLRERFSMGFRSGEQDDKFYIDSDYPSTMMDHVTRCSFMTQRVNDKKYLKEKEEELIKIFYDECSKSIDVTEKRLEKEVRKYNMRINNYKDIMKHFEYSKRGDKLLKIKRKIQEGD